MKIKRITFENEAGWWIIDTPEGVDEPVGPYRTKADAEDDLRGIKRFLKEEAKQ